MTGADLKAKFDNEWGAARKLLAAHPLTGAWIAAGVGFALGLLAHVL